jgi:carbon storage regulator
MLVLSRKESERIRLGDSIVITIVRVSGDKVRLGIEAPPNVLVLRDELKPLTLPLPVAEDQQLKQDNEPKRSEYKWEFS